MTTENRPLSPHLQIYKPQITSTLSILHRFTGVALSVGALLLVWWLIAAAAGPDAYAGVESFIGSWLGYIVMIGWSFSLFYHLCNGIRHLFWDAGRGFEITTVERSGWVVIIASLSLTAAAWIVALIVRGGGA